MIHLLLDLLPLGAGFGRRRGHDDRIFARGDLLQFLCIDQPSSLGGKSDDDALLLPALNEALEVAADAIPNAHKGEGPFVEDVAIG